MRPKRKVVVLAKSECSGSLMRMLLHVHGFTVFMTESVGEAVSLVSSEDCNLVVTELDSAAAIRKMRDVGEHVRVLLAGKAEATGLLSLATQVVLTGPDFNGRLVEAVKTAIARKRGPRKAAALKRVAA